MLFSVTRYPRSLMYWPIYSLLFSYSLLSVDAVHSLPAISSHRCLNLRRSHLRSKRVLEVLPGGGPSDNGDPPPQASPETTPVVNDVSPPENDNKPPDSTPGPENNPPNPTNDSDGNNDPKPSDGNVSSPNTPPSDDNAPPSTSNGATSSSDTNTPPSDDNAPPPTSNGAASSSDANTPPDDNTPSAGNGAASSSDTNTPPADDNASPSASNDTASSEPTVSNASPTDPPGKPSDDPPGLGGILSNLLGEPETPTGTPSTPAGESVPTPTPTPTPLGESDLLPTPTPTPTPTDGTGGVLDGVVGAVSSIVSGVTSGVGDLLNGATSTVVDVVAPVTTAVGDIVDGVSSTIGEVVAPASSTVGDIVDGLTSTVGEVVAPASSTVGDIVDGLTSTVGDAVGAATSTVGNVIPTITNAPADITSTAGDIIDDATSAAGVITAPAGAISQVTSSVNPEPTESEEPIILPPALSSLVSDVTVVLAPPSQTQPAVTLSGEPSIEFPPSTITNVPAAISSLSAGGTPTAVDPTAISFPTGLSGVIGSGAPTRTDTTGPTETERPPVSVESNFSFLTQSTLIVASVAPTVAPSLTDPDQATTTLSIPGVAATNTLAQAALPTGIPSRIYPQDSIPDGTDMTGLTLISILFNQELNWGFVSTHQDTSSQIFAFFPTVLQTALGVDSKRVKTYALQVYVPATYQSDADAAQLGTMYLGYVPSDLVDTLAAQMKAKSSAFYTGSQGVAQQLAMHVDPSFSLNAIPDPNPASAGHNSGGNSGRSNSARARQDAIIGVVSALGGIALIILSFLVYRSWKRRRELAHRRLSDPPGAEGYTGERPEGREFDQDSVGGQRRRSFYFAEDSLQGFQGERRDDGTFDHHNSPSSGMVQRRNLVPGTISAPILRGSTMNW